MIKSYVIDTNILIQAPYACQCFEENRVILPLVVLEELDGLKKAEGEKGANARRAIRFLEKLRLKGDLLKGVQMENGGILRVEPNCVNVDIPESLPENKPDNRILKVCKGIPEESAVWNQTKERRAVFPAGSIDEICRESSACNRKRDGRNGEDILFTGSRTGESPEQSDRGIQKNPDLQTECAV